MVDSGPMPPIPPNVFIRRPPSAFLSFHSRTVRCNFRLADGREQRELAGVLPRKVSFVGLNSQVAKANRNAHESHSSKEAGWPRSLRTCRRSSSTTQAQ